MNATCRALRRPIGGRGRVLDAGVVIYPRALRAGVRNPSVKQHLEAKAANWGDAGMPARILVLDGDPLSNC